MRIFAGILSAGLIAGIATAAQADGLYVGAETGVNLVPTTKFKDGGAVWKESHDPGYGVLGQIGYGFGPVRVEGELGWRSNGVDKNKQPFNTSGSGSLDAASVMANVYYDVKTGTNITPYFGVGVGGVDVNAEKIRANGVTLSNKDAFVFGYQGIAGASYALNDNLSLKADYRYLRTLDAKLKEDPSYGVGKTKADYQAHAIMIGFTYKFGAEAPKPVAAPAPAPVVAPAPAPAPKQVQAAPIAKNYMVFFDFNKSDITAEANRTISQAAQAAKSNRAASISLVGHTDAAGSEKYNMALSLRRANAVKAALVKLGIPGNEISVVGKGKSDPLVPTKDGVREPQNRRVQIILP
ncbi:MAG: OmpA family protein [Telmatospirillum sp.]|nr:OmpA family protein [Telmatospirillum sp.]